MPKTAFDKPKYSKLFVLLNGATAELNREEIGEIIGKSAQTARTRMRNPENLTLTELYKLCRKQQIPLEELRQAITY